MKKIVLAILFALFALNLNAQQYASPYYGFRLGLTAHPTFGFMKAENGKGNGLSLGFSYGLMGDFNFAENYSFATGITITTINGKTTEINAMPYHQSVSTSNPVAYDLKYKMQYIEVPLTVKLKTAKIGDLRWYGQFGLSNDFRIGAKQNAETSGTGIANDKNIKDWTHFYRAGLIIGGGAEFDLDGKTSLMMGLTLNNGFTNVISYGDNSVRNHYVGVNLGVFF
ncbi:porin family protein [Pedobacter sp. ASV12]|uniref:porin family protein n=1 Tax=Pedobacter sp. ASV12 TaxID=2795120 RepID=UPI0018EB836A|nr:porin family protein [Pedobacter sp. ASV12]